MFYQVPVGRWTSAVLMAHVLPRDRGVMELLSAQIREMSLLHVVHIEPLFLAVICFEVCLTDNVAYLRQWVSFYLCFILMLPR